MTVCLDGVTVATENFILMSLNHRLIVRQIRIEQPAIRLTAVGLFARLY